MKYKTGNIVCLNDGKTVYIFEVNEKEKQYTVINIDDDSDIFYTDEKEIFMLLTNI